MSGEHDDGDDGGSPRHCPEGVCPIKAAGLFLPCPCRWQPLLGAQMAKNPTLWAPKLISAARGMVGWRLPHEPPKGREPGEAKARAAATTAPRKPPAPPVPCVHLGEPILDADGSPLTRSCKWCRGDVRLKVFNCSHPAHASDPTTTVRACSACPDYTRPGGEPAPALHSIGDGPVRHARSIRGVRGPTPPEDTGGLPVKMVVPRERRESVRGMRYGVLQILVTRACDKSCFGCSAGSNLVSHTGVMTPDQFEQAVLSLGFGGPEPYWGTVGLFGGNPCTSRYFEDYCRILKTYVPYAQRGIWTNRLMGKGAIARTCFNPSVSNCNVHLDSEAYEEFKRDWPEALSARPEHTTRGLTDDSCHGSPWISMMDLETLPFPDGSSRENTEANRWELIGGCFINKNWSAIITLVGGQLRGFACEIQGHMAALHADNPDFAGTGAPMRDVGIPIEPGWWKRAPADFADQFRTCCHHCAVPLNRPGQLAIGGEREEFSETHRHIARPKVRSRPVAFVSVESLEKRDRPATEYLEGVTPGYRRQ